MNLSFIDWHNLTPSTGVDLNTSFDGKIVFYGIVTEARMYQFYIYVIRQILGKLARKDRLIVLEAALAGVT